MKLPKTLTLTIFTVFNACYCHCYQKIMGTFLYTPLKTLLYAFSHFRLESLTKLCPSNH